MAIPQLPLVFIGLIALLATLGLFMSFGDRWTGVLVEFTAAVAWALFALSSMDVVIVSDVDPPVSEPLMPLVILGLGLSVVTFAFFLFDLLSGTAAEASATDLENFG